MFSYNYCTNTQVVVVYEVHSNTQKNRASEDALKSQTNSK